MDQPSWPFGGNAVPGESQGFAKQAQVSWMGSDLQFEPQGMQ